MAKYDALPYELWGAILAHLINEDVKSVVAASRYLRSWRHLAWSKITMSTHNIEKLKRLATLLADDPSIRSYIRAISLRLPSHVALSWERLHQELNITIPAVLLLTPCLECFIFEAPLKGPHDYQLALMAICELRALKVLILSRVRLPASVATPRFYLKSRVLEHLTVVWGGGIDFCTFLGEQRHLRSVELPVDPLLSLDVATSWVAVKKLNMSVAIDIEGMAPDDFGRWEVIVAKGLVILSCIHAIPRSIKNPTITGRWSASPA
jgi:hypothetical protein